jgi:nicotinamidase-related amidase
MSFKEVYLYPDSIDHDISLLRSELSESMIRSRDWDPSLDSSALIITDLQNYFLSPDSHAFIPSATAILPNIVKLISMFREYDRPVIFTKHINNKENARSMAYWWNDLIEENSVFSEIFDQLDSPGDPIVIKHQYDAFHETGLEDLLQRNNTLYPVVCGVMANLCCETTVRNAFVKGFRPVLPIDATAAYNRQFHLATFRNLSFGFLPLMTTSEVIEKLRP